MRSKRTLLVGRHGCCEPEPVFTQCSHSDVLVLASCSSQARELWRGRNVRVAIRNTYRSSSYGRKCTSCRCNRKNRFATTGLNSNSDQYQERIQKAAKLPNPLARSRAFGAGMALCHTRELLRGGVLRRSAQWSIIDPRASTSVPARPTSTRLLGEWGS